MVRQILLIALLALAPFAQGEPPPGSRAIDCSTICGGADEIALQGAGILLDEWRACGVDYLSINVGFDQISIGSDGS